MGLMQALISVFADDGDKIRCINAGRTRISFLLRSPLYYACVSSWREPESVVSFVSVLSKASNSIQMLKEAVCIDQNTSRLPASADFEYTDRESIAENIRAKKQL